MTSGNFSGKPIAAENKDALGRLSPLADAFLLHNRHIQIRADDSVVRLDEGKPVFLRRSRGYAPYSVRLPCESKPMLAVGGERKNAFCLARDRYGFLSQHIGNLENAETFEAFEQAVQHLSFIFRLPPEIMAHDLHPNYFATRYAEHSAIPHIGIQHHHAHIAACMADNGLEDRRVIGLSFDGAGYGTDGAVWGGEVLLASYADFDRFAHLEYLPLPGDDFAIPAPWRLAVGYAHSLSIPVDDLPFLQNMDRNALRPLTQQTDRGQTAPLTSSLGALFNAVASLIGIRQEITYDAQAAIEMEVLAKPFILAASAYPYRIDQTEGGAVLRLREFLSAIVQDVHGREAVGMIGARFHKTVAAFAIEICQRARGATGLNEVVLSGGVWQNQILLSLVRQGLRQAEFTVYFHQQVPTNDGGLALGQAVIANHILARSEPVGERSHSNL